jgi:hypothetical protein
MLNETRDMAAAEKFFRSAKAVTGVTPGRVTTDGHDSYPRAIRSQLGADVRQGTASISTTALSRIIEGSRAVMGQCVASVPLTRPLAFADVMMNSGTTCTPITASAEPPQPLLVAVASFKQAASPSA